MKNQKSIASVLIFVGTLLCFFLPFATVSCGGMKLFTLTGQQLATGTAVTQPQLFGAPQTKRTDPDPFAAFAGVCALAGIALSLVGRKMANVTAVSAGAGALSLLVMRFRLDAAIQKQSQGAGSVHYDSGFTMVLLLFITAAAWNAFQFMQSRRARRVDVLDSAPPGLPLFQSDALDAEKQIQERG